MSAAVSMILAAAVAVSAGTASGGSRLLGQQPSTSSSAAGLAPPGGRIETKHLSLTTSVRRIAAGRLALVVEIAPKPKMHVYSPEQKDVIPVSLALTPAEGIRPGAATLPKPEKYFFAPLKETQLVYSKPFQIRQEVTVAKPADGLTITGTLRYQACDDSICYLPQTVPVSWTVAPKP
jgi:DsbC/DsbD-like thiol-disulfide interchange protein